MSNATPTQMTMQFFDSVPVDTSPQTETVYRIFFIGSKGGKIYLRKLNGDNWEWLHTNDITKSKKPYQTTTVNTINKVHIRLLNRRIKKLNYPNEKIQIEVITTEKE